MYCVHATYIYFKVHFHRKLPHQSKPMHLLQIAEIGSSTRDFPSMSSLHTTASYVVKYTDNLCCMSWKFNIYIVEQ